jgi:phage terminase large subunit-like protein
MAGRGYGKSRAGAEWLIQQTRNQPGTEWGVVARTTADLRATCFEGKGGLLRALGWSRDDPRYNKTDLLLRLDNGAVIHSYSAEEPSSVHGPNLSGVWLDEIAKWKSREMWDSLSFAIRDGDAQTVATTTPQRTLLVREFVNRTDGSVVITRGSTFENEKNLSSAFIAEQQIRWKGTRLERQELYGELLEDVPGALWKADTIERNKMTLID